VTVEYNSYEMVAEPMSQCQYAARELLLCNRRSSRPPVLPWREQQQ